MDQQKKIKNILNAIKFDVDSIEAFENELNPVLGMFNEIKEVNVEGVSSTLNRKKITLAELREDKAVDWNFRPEMRGKYFKVPNVSKK
jgi:aspartyl/glutamyl-tRNA(Asn/Gln) amidotransferase C subunit